MRHRQSRRRFVLRIVLALALLLTGMVAVRKIRDWPVERAMARFRTAPNDEHARVLVQWLANQAVTRKQGERILALLLRPEIATRRAYPAGQPAKMSVRTPHDIKIPQGRITLNQFVWATGRPIDACREWTSHPHILDAWVRPLEPGTYHAELRTECRIWHPRPNPSRWQQFWTRLCGRFLRRPWLRPRTSNEPTYEYHLVTPFDVNIVEKDQAEQLKLVATPEIDATIRTAVAITTSKWHRSYATAAGLRGYHDITIIEIPRLPIAIAFELSLRLADSRELPVGPGRRPQHIHLRAGDSRNCTVDVSCFGLEEPGDYAGTLILTPDPNYAYEDPAIKAIWDGTLEFPVSFSVYEEPQSQ